MVGTPREFFEKVLPGRFDASKAAGVEAVVQMNIAGSDGGGWVVTVKDQKMQVKEGTHPSPTITVRVADTDFVDLVNGRLGAVDAFMTGKLEFKGNIAVGMRLMELGFM